MRGYVQGVREWSGLVLSGKDGSGGGSECHVTPIHDSIRPLTHSDSLALPQL